MFHLRQAQNVSRHVRFTGDMCETGQYKTETNGNIF